MHILGKKWGHLIKTLEVKDGPAGLYPQARIWAEGKDWEGYQGNFSFGFFKEPCVCHPVEGAVVHPYDEALVFAGTDLNNMRNLDGGEISIELGEEREEHLFTEPTVVCIPKGTPHGPVRVRKVGRPIVHYLFGLDPVYRAEAIPASARPANVSTGAKYAHLVHPLRTNASIETIAGLGDESVLKDDPGFLERVAAAHPDAPADRSGPAAGDGVLTAKAVMGPGNGDAIIWMFGEDLNGFDLNFTWGFYSGTGKWHRPGEGHTHPEEEALVFVGLNPDDLGDLGAEISFKMGKEFEDQIFDKPTAVIAPAGFVHLPCVTRWCDRPYGFLVGCLGATHAAPWVHPRDFPESNTVCQDGR
ncbi:MAG: hypothetical protein GX113_07475 [Actinobacteria bacterium]|jgi:hypothetical protein|nr:hypothetical protein [Actinomycetota bacterium]